MKNKTRCLFIVPSLKRGGAETQLVDLINGIDNSLFEKHLVVLEDNLDQLDKVDRQNIVLHHLPKKSKLDWNVVRQIASLIDKYEIEAIHATMQYSVLFAWLARKVSKRPPSIVAAIHTTINVGLKEEVFDLFLYRYILRQCEKIIFVCHGQRNYWLKKYPELKENSLVIYNGVDVGSFYRGSFVRESIQLRTDVGIPESAYVICCIAGFRPEKGHFILLKAFSEIKQENVRLLLAGDGPLRVESESLVKELSIEDCVHFLGNLADVRPVLACSDVMVLPSTSETFSMAMLEAMAMEVPVIASDLGGLSEAIIIGETGMLTEPGNQASLTYTLQHCVMSNVRNEMGLACREQVEKNFTAKKMVLETMECLSKRHQ